MPVPHTDISAMPTAAFPEADILIAAPCWQDAQEAEAVVRRAIAAAAAMIEMPEGPTEVAIMLTDDDSVRTLNRDWRGLDKPTNVLSFPAAWQDEPAPGTDAPQMLGDIAIAYQTTRREAESEGKPFADHLSHLAVHGFLHLLGYDHMTDDEAAAMEGLERDILARLGIPDPYASPDLVD